MANEFQNQKLDRITLQLQQTVRVDMQLRIGVSGQGLAAEQG